MCRPPFVFLSVGEQRLVGVSLYTPRLNEIAYPNQKWNPQKEVSEKVFRLQIPCSWGGLYFRPVWNDFLEFYALRVAPPFFNFTQEARQSGKGKHRQPLGDTNVMLPHSRSNSWPRSWKRFMVDFMYGRGLTMIYPNLPQQRSFSTTFMEKGSHSGKDGKMERESEHKLRQGKSVDNTKTVPLLSLNHSDAVAFIKLESLPALDSLPTFDMYHERKTHWGLVATGRAFVEGIQAKGAKRDMAAAAHAPPGGYAPLYARLARAWGGPTASEAAGAARELKIGELRERLEAQARERQQLESAPVRETIQGARQTFEQAQEFINAAASIADKVTGFADGGGAHGGGAAAPAPKARTEQPSRGSGSAFRLVLVVCVCVLALSCFWRRWPTHRVWSARRAGSGKAGADDEPLITPKHKLSYRCEDRTSTPPQATPSHRRAIRLDADRLKSRGATARINAEHHNHNENDR